MRSFLKLFKKQQYSPTQDSGVNRYTITQYLEAMGQYKKYVVLAGTGIVLATVCLGAGLPFALAQAIEQISQHQPLEWGSSLATTLCIAATLAAIGVAGNALAFRNLSTLDPLAQNYLRQKAFARLTKESASFYANTMTGSLTSQIIIFTNGYSIVQETVFLRGLSMSLPLVASIVITAFQSLLLAGVFLGITGIIAVKTLRDSKTRTPYRRARKAATTALNGFIGDVISNNAAIRTFAREVHELQALLRNQKLWQTAWQKNLLVFGRHNAQLIAGIHLLQVAGITLAAWLAVTGRLSLGLVVFAVAYFQRLSTSLLELAPVVQTFQGILMEAAPISEILMRQPAVIDKPRAKKLKVHKGKIAVDAITYRYEDDTTPVFANLSVQIPAGQSVGLVGRSGSGKTTLTNLLLRVADVESGTIAIDGQDISHIRQQSLRDTIAYVPQDSMLFHRTIRENIAYGKPNASNKEIIAVAKRAHIWELIQQLPEGLDTMVGERGVKLSGGQRQRVAIARAILKKAPILVLDEATSALDSESEQYIQASLDEVLKGRTSVVIAHRLSTIQKMDRILVMDKGRIVEDGTHAQLVKKKGMYATLWAHQSGGFID